MKDTPSTLSYHLRLFNLSVFLRSHFFLLPILFLFYSQHGITAGDFFLLQGLSTLICIVADVPFGYLADLYSKRKILILSNILIVLRLLILLFIPSYTSIFISEFIFALAIVSFVGTYDAYIYELLKSSNHTAKMLEKYGKNYFWISLGAAISSLCGAWIFNHFNIKLLLLINLAFIVPAIIILLFLPETPKYSKNIHGLKEKYIDLWQILVKSFKNPYLKNLMIFSGFLTAAYQIFLWGMQPLMKLAIIPVSIFGFIYFLNNTSRALGGYLAHKLFSSFKLKRLGYVAYIFFLISFTALLCVADTLPVWVNLSLLIFVCLSCIPQVAFLCVGIQQIHDHVDSKERSTYASINSMWGRLFSAICLISMKFIFDGLRLKETLFIFFALFTLAIIPLLEITRRHGKHSSQAI